MNLWFRVFIWTSPNHWAELTKSIILNSGFCVILMPMTLGVYFSFGKIATEALATGAHSHLEKLSSDQFIRKGISCSRMRQEFMKLPILTHWVYCVTQTNSKDALQRVVARLVSFLGWLIFRCELLVSGRVLEFQKVFFSHTAHQLMVNCWFGLGVWNPIGSPYDRDCYFGVPSESQTTGPQTDN